MDPITALATLVAAIFNYATEHEKGMTPEQKKQFNDWVIQDVKFWRKLFGIPEA